METTIKKDNIRLEIKQDLYPTSPREDENLAIMTCFHKRYNLGDEHDYKLSDFESWEQLKKQIIKDENPICIKPLYIYDHSSITISTTPFSCRWDSGQIGFIYIRKKDMLEGFGGKRCSKKLKTIAEKNIDAEVEVYDHYLNGEVFQYELYVNDELVDSCGGFYDVDFWTNGMYHNIDNEYTEVLHEELVKEFGERIIKGE